MVVNDDAGYLAPNGVLRFFASKLAPTGECAPTKKGGPKAASDTSLTAYNINLPRSSSVNWPRARSSSVPAPSTCTGLLGL